MIKNSGNPRCGPVFGGGGKVAWVWTMFGEPSRSEEYLDGAAEMRRLALNTRYPEARTRLLMMAAGFERLADQVEKWEDARLANAAE